MAMMFWYGHNVGGWGWFAMSAGVILFWALIITIAVMLFR
jgi:putative membrane protein